METTLRNTNTKENASLSLSFSLFQIYIYIYINMRFFNALEGNPNPDQAKVQDSFEEKPKGPECFFSFFKNIKFFFFLGLKYCY